jgi:hypothetical protein
VATSRLRVHPQGGGEPWWNDTDGKKLNNSEKNLFKCHLVHHNSDID